MNQRRNVVSRMPEGRKKGSSEVNNKTRHLIIPPLKALAAAAVPS